MIEDSVNLSNLHRRSQQGLGLIDVLLALLVVCVGMLALASLHLGLARSSDGLRQRGEATRRAQSLVERLRVPEPSQARAEPATLDNTAYLTRSTRNGSQLSVAVTWQDRAGQPQSTELTTQVSTLDAAGLAVQAFASPPTTFTSNDRHSAVPLDAEKGDRDRSRVRDGGLAFSYAIDNASGLVSQRCVKSTNAESTLRDCEKLLAYLVSGFIRFGPGVPAAGLALDTARPLLIAAPAASGAPAALDCSASLQVVWRDPATGRTSRLPAGQPATAAGARQVDRFVAYVCIATPVDDDHNPATAATWSGDLTLNPSGWKAGTGVGSYQVQRIGHTTQKVARSLDQQNFLITPAGTISSP